MEGREKGIRERNDSEKSGSRGAEQTERQRKRERAREREREREGE